MYVGPTAQALAFGVSIARGVLSVFCRLVASCEATPFQASMCLQHASGSACFVSPPSFPEPRAVFMLDTSCHEAAAVARDLLLMGLWHADAVHRSFTFFLGLR